MFDIKGGETVIFTKKHRTDAAKFAIEINSGKKAIIEAIKAFFSLRVAIVANEKAESYIKECKEKVDTALNKNLVDRVITPQGFDARIKRGKAMDYERQAVIRTWPFKGIMSPGHAAVSVKNNLEYDDAHTYISWWPSTTRLRGAANHFSSDTRIGQLITSRRGASSDSYMQDKYDELSDRARDKLTEGSDPRERQKVLARPDDLTMDEDNKDQQPWGVSADKVYLPLVGTNQDKQTEEEFFSVFGLHEAKMDLFWKNIENAEDEDSDKYAAKYKMLSKNHSCVGMALTALEQGGAELFIKKIWPSRTSANPNYMHGLAIKLQERLDTLNEKSQNLLDAYEEQTETLDKKDKKTTEKELRSVITQIRDKLEKYPNEPTTTEIKNIYRHFNRILKMAQQGKLNLSSMTPHLISIVEKITFFRENSEKWRDNKAMDLLFLCAYKKTCELMEKTYKTETERYNQLRESLD